MRHAELLGFYRDVGRGLAEVRGPGSNARLLAMIRRWIPWAEDDSTTAWCGILRAEAARHTASVAPEQPFRARMWLTVGTPVALENALPGDTVVLERGRGGHVGLYVSREATTVRLLGGNQHNRVCEADYPIADALGVRRI